MCHERGKDVDFCAKLNKDGDGVHLFLCNEM